MNFLIDKNGRPPNGRFGATAAVTPQKRQCEFRSLYPATTVVEAATAPSCWDVVRKPRKRGRTIWIFESWKNEKDLKRIEK